MASIKKVGKGEDGRTIFDVHYRLSTSGKKVHRRIRAYSRSEVERIVALDSGRSGIDLKWSEGLEVYVKAKKQENRNAEAIAHAERAVSVFTQLMGDLAVEDTSSDALKTFLQLVANGAKVRDIHDREYTTKGPGVANHHRKELITIARYLQNHAGKITSIPFLHVPPLPLVKKRRKPIHKSEVNEYLEALQPHVRRPVEMVLYFGLRSTAICNIQIEDVKPGYVVALDKNSVLREIPIDSMLASIVEEALSFRKTFESPADRLFVNKAGRAWNHTSLLRAAQRYWLAAGLEKKKIHEVRHTLGTLASKSFPQRMVQAAMGHTSEQSSATYFHPDEEMAAEVRQKIVADLWQNDRFMGATKVSSGPPEASVLSDVFTQYLRRIFSISNK